MPKNLGIEDIKPFNKSITDQLPQNKEVEDVRPKGIAVKEEFLNEQFFTVIINVGQWLGFGGFTYTTTGTVQSPKTS